MSEQEGSKLINCFECGNDFVFTIGEQEFFKSKGYSDPKRCVTCRRKKREQRDSR
jgi:hypothetical protein